MGQEADSELLFWDNAAAFHRPDVAKDAAGGAAGMALGGQQELTGGPGGPGGPLGPKSPRGPCGGIKPG